MGSIAKVRLLGVISNIVIGILYIVGIASERWTSFNNGESKAGLWVYCNLPINYTSTEAPPIDFGTTHFWTTTEDKVTEKDKKKDDEEDDCDNFGITDADGYLHGTRVLLLLTLACVAVSMFHFKTLVTAVSYSSSESFFDRHKGELLNLLGAILAKTAVEIYSEFSSSDSIIGEMVQEDGRADTARDILNVAVYLTIPSFLFLISPTLQERCPSCCERTTSSPSCPGFKEDPLGAIYRFITCKKEPVERNRQANPELTMSHVEANRPPPRRGSLVIEPGATRHGDRDADSISLHSQLSIRELELSSRDPTPKPFSPPPSYEEVLAQPPGPWSSSSSLTPFNDHSLRPGSGPSAMPPPPSYEEATEFSMEATGNSTV